MTTALEHLTVDCPRCGAPAGYPCNAATEGVARAQPHIERYVTEVDYLRGILRTAVDELDDWRDKGSDVMRDDLVDDFIEVAKGALRA